MKRFLKPTYDLAVLGSGFGGSLLSMVAKRIGLSVVLIERGRHPRFAIGESTSPLINLLIEQLARRYDLPRLLPLTSYGPWQRSYPDLACGLKRGFTFFKHVKGRPYQVAPDRSNQLLVAASPCDELADTHWLRADVDQFLMREAVDIGVDYIDEAELGLPQFGHPISHQAHPIIGEGRNTTRGVTLTGRRRGEPFQIGARFVVDATGPRGFLSKVLDIPEDPFPNYPRTQTLFSHFTGVRRCDTIPGFLNSPLPSEERAGSGEGQGVRASAEVSEIPHSTFHIPHSPSLPPYPIDDAALHHVFDGGWMWVLRLGNGVTSAGIAVTEEFGVDIGIHDGEAAWPRFLRRYPSIEAQFVDAKAILPFRYSPRLSYRASTMVGDDWAMLPSAAAFIDPLFSTGFPLTLLGIERLGAIFEEAWAGDSLPERLQEYAAACRAEGEATAALIAGAYGGMRNFPAFASLSMFYFAAASFSEMQRRLSELRPSTPAAYLQSNHPQFAASMARYSMIVRDGAVDMDGSALEKLDREVAEAVDCINIAGLCDPAKANWYGVDLADVVRGASKLGFTREEMQRTLDEADWVRC